MSGQVLFARASQSSDDRATKPLKPIFDTFGVVRGSEFPNELVIIGGHRDGWGPGTADNVSGTVSVLEAARAVAEEVKAGARPKRTIIFATWDAEEWGLIGSTEFVEDDSLRLSRQAVAYFNQDVAAQGPRFGGGGSPSLRPMLRDVARSVPDPNGKGSVYAEWRASRGAPRFRRARDGRSGRRFGFRRFLQPSRDSDRRMGIRRRKGASTTRSTTTIRG